MDQVARWADLPFFYFQGRRREQAVVEAAEQTLGTGVRILRFHF
jgi:hypothetical protein